MLIYMCTAAQFAEILSFVVHLSICFTVRKGIHPPVQCTGNFFSVLGGLS